MMSPKASVAVNITTMQNIHRFLFLVQIYSIIAERFISFPDFVMSLYRSDCCKQQDSLLSPRVT